jgi:hypothetical protein
VQVFLRLIWWLRGTSHLVEHYFTQHAVYSFNSTSDSFTVFGEELMRAYSRATDKKAEGQMIAHLIEYASPSSSVTLVFRCASQPRWLGPSSLGFFLPVLPRIAVIVRGFAGQCGLRGRSTSYDRTSARLRMELITISLCERSPFAAQRCVRSIPP